MNNVSKGFEDFSMYSYVKITVNTIKRSKNVQKFFLIIAFKEMEENLSPKTRRSFSFSSLRIKSKKQPIKLKKHRSPCCDQTRFIQFTH